MKLETFFEKFDQFADAPNAVAKMRELVRNFAVTGKLVAQDPNDEPAEVLVARIAAALPDKKSENPFRGEIETTITDESEYELPPGWAWLPLGHVGIWATGCGFPMQYQGETDGEFLFCKVSDMNLPGNEVEIHRTVHSIDADVMKKIRARANPVGTVIFPKIGGAIATHKRRLVIKPTIIDNNCSGIQPIGLTDDRWLLLFMRSLDLTKYQSGTSVPAVSQGSLDPIRIGLPPLAEQKRIVAKVDELMALCDRLALQQQERETRHAALARASLARFADAPTPANLNLLFHSSFHIHPSSLRQSILTLAVQGKLVPQDPNDEPAEELMRVISAEQERLVKSRQIRRVDTARLNENDEPFGIPSTWVWTRLGKVGDWGSGSTPPRGNHELYGGSIPWLKSGELNDNQSLADAEETVTEMALKTCSFRLNKPGDVLLAMYGATIGKAAILSAAAVTNQAVCGCTPFPGVLNIYLFQYLVSQREAFHASSEGGAQPNISKVKIINHPFPLPPLAEQRRIVAKVDQLMALVDALETQLAASRATAANLLSATVAELTAA